MWPGWSTVVTSPPDRVSVASSSAIAAFWVPYAPNGAAMDQVLGASADCLYQRVRRVGCEADHVHHRFGLERSNPLPECPRRVLGRPVHLDLLDLRPRLVVDVIRSVGAAGQVDNLVTGAD